MSHSEWIDKSESASGIALSAEEIKKNFGLPIWVANVLRQRMNGWLDPSLSAVEKFLKPTLKNLPDPFSLPDMREAAECVADAIESEAPIAIFGDYDVDGTVGTALLRRFFRMLGVDPRVEQPDRKLDGYGMNLRAVERLAAEGIQLLITVDCGISNYREVSRANELGLTVVVCDHHEVPENMPPAAAVLDHKRKDNNGPIRSLCGAGMGFYLALAVRSVLRERGFFHEKPEPDLRELLDLVAIATVADMVPLVDENRILVQVGLEKIRKNPIVGVRELLAVANIKQNSVTPYHIGFIIGPRINASGRLGSASTALALLSSDDAIEARELATILHSVNDDRKELQSAVLEEAKTQAKNFSDSSAMVLAGDDWHEGVIGIVASKIVEESNRPALLITFATQTGVGKGSVRAGNKIDALKALETCRDLLEGFGGHKAAAGLSIKKENLEKFREQFCAAVTAQIEEMHGSGITQIPVEVLVDGAVKGADLTEEQILLLGNVGPFGMGNPEPVFASYGLRVKEKRWLKERHLRLTMLTSDNKQVEGIWFGAVDKLKDVPELIDVAFIPGISTFRDRNNVELRIKEIRAHQNKTS